MLACCHEVGVARLVERVREKRRWRNNNMAIVASSAFSFKTTWPPVGKITTVSFWKYQRFLALLFVGGKWI